jgi:aryl-alcohol dehydrogenase-like predicted oxidoreductase
VELRRRALGTTRMEITQVGFGAAAVGGAGWASSWGDQDDDVSIAAIRYALDQGVNWIDTAAVYGLGHSEEVVARALQGIPARDRPFVFTKCGLVWDEADRLQEPREVGRPDAIRQELEASLRRLRVERIDLYQMHWPARDGTPLEEYLGCLLDLQREGKIRAAGLSNHNVGQLEAAERLGHVNSLQLPFSLIKREAGADVISWCREHNTGVIVYSPMQAGLLTGAFSQARAASLSPDDWRSRDAEFHGHRLTRNLGLAEALRPIGARLGESVAAVAVAWTLSWQGVTGAIVGARSPKQVDGWIAAGAMELGPDELEQIAAAAQGVGEGPTHP